MKLTTSDSGFGVQGSGFDPKQSNWPAIQQGSTRWSESEINDDCSNPTWTDLVDLKSVISFHNS